MRIELEQKICIFARNFFHVCNFQFGMRRYFWPSLSFLFLFNSLGMFALAWYLITYLTKLNGLTIKVQWVTEARIIFLKMRYILFRENSYNTNWLNQFLQFIYCCLGWKLDLLNKCPGENRFRAQFFSPMIYTFLIEQ